MLRKFLSFLILLLFLFILSGFVAMVDSVKAWSCAGGAGLCGPPKAPAGWHYGTRYMNPGNRGTGYALFPNNERDRYGEGGGSYLPQIEIMYVLDSLYQGVKGKMDIPPDGWLTWDWSIPGLPGRFPRCHGAKSHDLYVYYSGSVDPFGAAKIYYPSKCTSGGWPVIRGGFFGDMDGNGHTYMGFTVPDDIYFYWFYYSPPSPSDGGAVCQPEFIEDHRAVFKCDGSVIEEVCPGGNCMAPHNIGFHLYVFVGTDPLKFSPECKIIEGLGGQKIMAGGEKQLNLKMTLNPWDQRPRYIEYVSGTPTAGAFEFSPTQTLLADMVYNESDVNNPYYSMSTTIRATGAPGTSSDLSIKGSFWDEDGGVWVDLDCEGSGTFKIATPTKWWQVGGGDVVANGNIESFIPGPVLPDPGTCIPPVCNPFLIKQNPGIAIFGGSLDLNDQDASEPDWQVNSSVSNYSSYSYESFKNKVDIENTFVSSQINCSILNSGSDTNGDGYIVYATNAGAGLTIDDLITVTSCNLTNKKVILFVDGVLTIKKPINLTKGQGFFMAIVSGNIQVDAAGVGGDLLPGIYDLEGIFFTEKQFLTGTTGLGNDTRLYVRGSIVGLGTGGTNDGVVQERVPADNTLKPSELFEFAPDLMFNFPSFLGDKSIVWQEVAP